MGIVVSALCIISNHIARIAISFQFNSLLINAVDFLFVLVLFLVQILFIGYIILALHSVLSEFRHYKRTINELYLTKDGINEIIIASEIEAQSEIQGHGFLRKILGIFNSE